MNETIKSKTAAKNGRMEDSKVTSFFLENFIIEFNELIFSTKTLYYENLAKKLNNPLFQAKTYWSQDIL